MSSNVFLVLSKPLHAYTSASVSLGDETPFLVDSVWTHTCCLLRTRTSKHLKNNHFFFYSYEKKDFKGATKLPGELGRCQSSTVCTRPHSAERSNQLSDNTCVAVQSLKMSCRTLQQFIYFCKCLLISAPKVCKLQTLLSLLTAALVVEAVTTHNCKTSHLFSLKQWSVYAKLSELYYGLILRWVMNIRWERPLRGGTTTDKSRRARIGWKLEDKKNKKGRRGRCLMCKYTTHSRWCFPSRNAGK